MTDDELIAALGWECKWVDSTDQRGEVWWWCATHNSERHYQDAPPDMCKPVCALLDAARAGIDLAKRGIADEIENYSVAGSSPEFRHAFTEGMQLAAHIAREEWTP